MLLKNENVSQIHQLHFSPSSTYLETLKTARKSSETTSWLSVSFQTGAQLPKSQPVAINMDQPSQAQGLKSWPHLLHSHAIPLGQSGVSWLATAKVTCDFAASW